MAINIYIYIYINIYSFLWILDVLVILETIMNTLLMKKNFDVNYFAD